MRSHLVRWHEQYADRGLVIIEIDGGKHENVESTRRSVAQKGVKHRVLWDEANRNHERFGIHVWPRAFLLGPDGRVLWKGNPARVIRRPEKLEAMKTRIEGALGAARQHSFHARADR